MLRKSALLKHKNFKDIVLTYQGSKTEIYSLFLDSSPASDFLKLITKYLYIKREFHNERYI